MRIKRETVVEITNETKRFSPNHETKKRRNKNQQPRTSHGMMVENGVDRVGNKGIIRGCFHFHHTFFLT